MLEEKIREAILTELERQAERSGGKLKLERGERLKVEGTVDLDALAMAVVGSVAGGP